VLDLSGSGDDPDEAVESIQLRFHHGKFHLASHVTVSVLVTPYNMHLQPVLTFIFVSVCHARVQLQDIKKLDIVVNCCRLSILLASSLIFSWKSPSSHSSFSSPGDQAMVKAWRLPPAAGIASSKQDFSTSKCWRCPLCT
jgi:hypothetical protein